MADRDRTRDRHADDDMDLQNPLGIADTPIAPDASDKIRASDDEASVRRRRARAGLGHTVEERRSTGLGDLNIDADGAAGIDMGYGGEGTDIKPSR